MPFEHSFQAQTDLVHFINTPLQKVLLEGLHGIEGTHLTPHIAAVVHMLADVGPLRTWTTEECARLQLSCHYFFDRCETMSTHSCPLGFSAATPKRSKCRRFCPLLIPLMLKACMRKDPLKSSCLGSSLIIYCILLDRHCSSILWL